MERERMILKEVVESYIDSGEAVGSRALSERLNRSLSAASIRAVLYELGQRGYLTQPHTSAGRVPTDLGFRSYIDQLLGQMLSHRGLRQPDRRRLESLDWSEGVPATDVLRAAARATAEHLGVAAAVIMPRLDTLVLQRLELVYLRPGRVLAVAVTSSGLVRERLVHVDTGVGRGDLEAFTNYLNALLPGRTLAAVRRTLEEAHRRDQDAVAQQAVLLGQRAFERPEHGEMPDVMVEGTSKVLAQREFAESPGLSSDLVRTLEERSAWLELLDGLVSASDVRVYLGREAGHAGFESCAVVATRYGAGAGQGVVAVIGPKRIDYRRAVPWVKTLGERLGTIFGAPG